MQRQFQQFVEFFVPLVQLLDRVVDISAACRSWYAQCTLCRPWPFTGTVFGWLWTRLLLYNDRYSGWLRRKLWSLRSCSGWASSSSWTRSLCPLVQRRGCALLGSTVVTCSASSRVAFGRIFPTFLVSGWTRILRSILVASLPVLMPKMKWPRSSSTFAVACFCWNCWYFCTSRCAPDVCRHDVMHTVRSVHSRCFSFPRAALGNLYIISTSPLYFQLEHSQL